jgi:hypothetical protein
MQERWLDETNIYKSLVEEDKAERFLIFIKFENDADDLGIHFNSKFENLDHDKITYHFPFQFRGYP